VHTINKEIKKIMDGLFNLPPSIIGDVLEYGLAVGGLLMNDTADELIDDAITEAVQGGERAHPVVSLSSIGVNYTMTL